MNKSIELVAVKRGKVIEEIHRGTIVITSSNGERQVFGRKDWIVPLRSTAKPFQILPLLERGGAEVFGIDPADIAIMASSHNGERAHVQRVVNILRKAGFQDQDLNCGTHPAYYPDIAKDIVAEYRDGPRPFHNNCSGKHAGMLLLCALEGLDKTEYWDVSHPIQRLIREAVCRSINTRPNDHTQVLDGCGVPSLCARLESLAEGYKNLSVAIQSEPESPLGRVGTAMMSHPFMVAGTHRADTEIMKTCPVVAKSGTSGVFGVAVPNEGIGIAIKVESGSEDASESVVIEVLRQLGVLNLEASEALDAYCHIPIKTWTGINAGIYEPIFRLA